MSEDASKIEATPGFSASLHGWVLPVAGLACVGLLAGAHLLGWVGDGPVASIASLAYGLALVGIAVRAGFERSSSRIRAVVMTYAVAFAVVGLYPAYVELFPGAPTATAQLGESQRAMALPSGGSYRLVVSAPLASGRDAHVNYRLKVGTEPLDGVLERVTTYQRVRRGSAMPVAEDHNVSAHEVRIADGASVVLDSVSGEASGTALTVNAFKILPPWLVYALMALLLVVGTVLEGRLLARGALSMTCGAAILFGLLIKTTNPATILGPVLGSALLAAGGGALLGSALASIGRRLFADREPVPSEKRGRARSSGGAEARGA